MVVVVVGHGGASFAVAKIGHPGMFQMQEAVESNPSPVREVLELN